MAALTVFLAPPGSASGVLDVLQDLSGVGLVGPFVWVTDGVDPAWTVDGGRRTATALHEVLVDARTTRVRLCVLVPGDGPVLANDVEEDVHERLRAQTGLSTVTRVRALLVRSDDAVSADVLARDGWHNVLVAPEDSRGPGLGHTVLPPAEHPVDTGRHAAPTLAGLLGLWRDVPDCVLDGLTLPPGASVRAVRAFFRRVEADDLERELRAAVLTTGPELPLPVHHGSPAVPIRDVEGACTEVASLVWGRHAGVLQGPRTNWRPTPVRPMGVGESLRWFLWFLANALRRIPRDLAEGLGVRASQRVAAEVQRLVYGQESAYQVVVGGMTGQGPMLASDLAAASQQLDVQLTGGVVRQDGEVDLTPLWRDISGGALSLADGADRGIRAVQIGAQRGVLRRPGDVAPGPGSDFAVPAALQGRVRATAVGAADVLGVHLLRASLGHLVQDPVNRHLALQADGTRQDLDRWHAAHRRSYTVRIADTLAGRLLSVAQEVGRLIAFLRDADTELDDLGRRARGVYGRIRVAAVVALLVLVGVVVLGFLDLLSWPAAGLVAGTVVVVWLLVALVVYLLEQRRMFQELHRRRDLLGGVDAVQLDLRQAVADLRLLSRVYIEFMPWARALGTVLAAPFGPAPRRADRAARIVRGLPRSTRVADVGVHRGRVEDAARALRQGLYTTGWLTPCWDHALEAARGAERELRPDWDERIAARGAAAGDEVWRAVVGRLDAPGVTLGQDLLATVHGVEEGSPPVEHITEFLGGIDRPGAGGRFDGSHFTDDARTADSARVDLEQVRRTREGLGTQAVLVQLGVAVPAEALRTATATGAAGRPDPAHAAPRFEAF